MDQPTMIEECPPGCDCASGEGDPSRSDNPPASWTPNPAGEQDQGVSRGDDISQAASHSPELKGKKDLSTTSGPMAEWHQAALVALQENLKLNVKMFQLGDMLGRPAGGFMDRAEVLRVNAKTGDMEQMGELINILLGKEDMAFYTFCDLLQRSNYEVWARELKSAADRLKTVEAPNEGSQTARRISVSKPTAPALTCSSDLNDILHTYTTGIITCDMDVIRSQKEPEKAIKSLFFNTYSMLIRILRNCFDSIKASALDAALMQAVDATEEEVNQAQDLNALFRCLNINKNWNELHFLDVAIISLPPEESVKRAAALLVLGRYKSYLGAYQKAIAIKEGKSEFGLLQRKRGREERWVVTEVTVDKDITDYTYADCLELWKLFLIKGLEIPKDRIKFCLARAGNSTTLVFMIVQTYAEGIKKKLSKPAAVWVMKELCILRVYVAGVVSMDLREVLPNMLIASIREGLESGVDFVSLTKVIPPPMCSLLDPVPESKETQACSIQLYSVGPAEQSVPEPVVEAASNASVVKDLLVAAAEGRLHEVQSLLGGGRCRVNDEDEEGFTAILKASLYGHLTVLRTLIEQYGGNVLHRKKKGRNAFLLCAVKGHLAIAKYLAPKMDGHLFVPDDVGYTALHWAAQEGQLSTVEYLVRSCAFDVKAIDKWGYTPLLRAVVEGHAGVVHFLLARGSSVQEQNNDGWTAVLIAARHGHQSLVQELCETFGADLLHRKKGRNNAFHLCAMGGHLAVAEYLVPKMEGHLFVSDDDGYTALHWAAQGGQLPMVEYLVRSCGFDVKARDKWGYTPLLRAVVTGHADIARFLLASGSVFNERNSRGESALQIAVREGHLDVVKVLVQAYRDCHMESEIDQYYMDLADVHHHEHVVGYLSSEFPSLKRKVPVPQPRPTRYPNVWSISGLTYPDY